MKIVVDISEDVYNRCKEYRLQCGEAEVLESAVARGTPLPKGHGRLVDADALYDQYEYADYDFYETLEYAPTIIEADRRIKND